MRIQYMAKAICGALTVAAIATQIQAQVVISDFDTVRPMTDFSHDPPANSWNDTIIENGHQTVGLVSAVHAGGGTATFFGSPLNLSAETSLRLTASRIDNDDNGVFRLILFSGPDLNTAATVWDFTPSLFPSESSGNTANAGNFGSVDLTFASGTPVLGGGADLSAVTAFRLRGSPAIPNTIFQARFDNLSAVPEPSEYAFVAALGLIGFAVYRRQINSRQAVA